MILDFGLVRFVSDANISLQYRDILQINLGWWKGCDVYNKSDSRLYCYTNSLNIATNIVYKFSRTPKHTRLLSQHWKMIKERFQQNHAQSSLILFSHPQQYYCAHMKMLWRISFSWKRIDALLFCTYDSLSYQYIVKHFFEEFKPIKSYKRYIFTT